LRNKVAKEFGKLVSSLRVGRYERYVDIKVIVKEEWYTGDRFTDCIWLCEFPEDHAAREMPQGMVCLISKPSL
jgi:hypothetical protein